MVVVKCGNIVDDYRRQSLGWREIFDDDRCKGGDSLNVFKFENKKIVVAIWGDLWTDSLLNQLEKISNEIEFISWPLYIDYEKEVLRSSVKEECKNQLSKIQCKVLMINGCSNDLNEARGGFYIFESDTIIEESPLGKEGILITDF